MYTKHQNHMNIMESRKAAMRYFNKHKGIRVYIGDTRQAKGRVLNAIKSGIFDGYFYGVEMIGSTGNSERVIMMTHFNTNNLLRKIGH